MTDRLGHDRHYSLDFSKIRAELGYEPELSLEKGQADTVAWIDHNREWWEPLKHRAAS